ncbi:LOW QUALITY PROTEIN: Colorectal cancer-associated protein 2, partial [Galemys pyrenaicus]
TQPRTVRAVTHRGVAWSGPDVVSGPREQLYSPGSLRAEPAQPKRLHAGSVRGPEETPRASIRRWCRFSRERGPPARAARRVLGVSGSVICRQVEFEPDLIRYTRASRVHLQPSHGWGEGPGVPSLKSACGSACFLSCQYPQQYDSHKDTAAPSLEGYERVWPGAHSLTGSLKLPDHLEEAQQVRGEQGPAPPGVIGKGLGPGPRGQLTSNSCHFSPELKLVTISQHMFLQHTAWALHLCAGPHLPAAMFTPQNLRYSLKMEMGGYGNQCSRPAWFSCERQPRPRSAPGAAFEAEIQSIFGHCCSDCGKALSLCSCSIQPRTQLLQTRMSEKPKVYQGVRVKITVKELLQQRRAHQAASGVTVSMNLALLPMPVRPHATLGLARLGPHPRPQPPSQLAYFSWLYFEPEPISSTPNYFQPREFPSCVSCEENPSYLDQILDSYLQTETHLDPSLNSMPSTAHYFPGSCQDAPFCFSQSLTPGSPSDSSTLSGSLDYSYSPAQLPSCNPENYNCPPSLDTRNCGYASEDYPYAPWPSHTQYDSFPSSTTSVCCCTPYEADHLASMRPPEYFPCPGTDCVGFAPSSASTSDFYTRETNCDICYS